MRKVQAYVFLFFILYFIVAIVRGCVHNQKIMQRYADVQKTYQHLQVRHNELKLQVEQVNAPAFIELTARDKLGLVKPGEIAYKIVEE